MVAGLGKIGVVPELRKRVIFTLLMIAIYRLGVFVSTPGINIDALKNLIDTSTGTIFGMINMFNGGSLERFSIFTLGIMPYITVSIIMQFITPVIPTLEALKKEGASGQKIITRYTRQGTIFLALIQGMFIARGLQSQPGLVIDPGLMFIITTTITLAAGTAFIMWLAEQITERGIGNGMSIIIFAGIIAAMPGAFYTLLQSFRQGLIQPLTMIFILLFCLATIIGIVFVERCFRKVPVQYPKKMIGNAVAQQVQTQYLPLKVNMAGVIPPIFASAFLLVPGTIASFTTNEFVQDLQAVATPGTLPYTIVFSVLIIIFCYYYTSVVYNPVEVADNLKKNGGFVPTVRPGKQTSDFLYKVLNRLTFWGALYIVLVCIIPQIVYMKMGLVNFSYIFGGTSILIVVAVTLDTFNQIQTYVVSKNYDEFIANMSKSGAQGRSKSKVLRR